MCTQEQSQTHIQSSYEYHKNHPHTTYRCYIRTPDMKCKVQNVCTDQSVSELKEQVRNVLGLGKVVELETIKLVVNEVELTDEMNLVLHLFQNAIIHVLVSQQKGSQDTRDRKIRLLIKQPPISCQIYTIQQWLIQLPISDLKSAIIKFYQEKYPSNPIATLQFTDFYLVYGGRILVNNKTILDYDIQENGVIYVVNGKIYAREVTKQEAERRIQEVKRGQNNEAEVNARNDEENQLNELHKENSAINESQDVVFNIIENIVHDEDSDVEGETADDMARSQKIIRRYDSMNNVLQSKNEDCVVRGEGVEEVEYESEADQKIKQVVIERNLKKIGDDIQMTGEGEEIIVPRQRKVKKVVIQNDRPIESITNANRNRRSWNSINDPQYMDAYRDNEDQEESNFKQQVVQSVSHKQSSLEQTANGPEYHQAVHQYINSVNQQIADIEGQSLAQPQSPQNNLEGVSQTLQHHPDSLPQNQQTQDEDLLL